MADLLRIGATALSTYRSALNAVGENVANSQTPGYSRRIVSLAEVGTGLNGARSASASVQFNGVSVESIQRNWQERLARTAWDSGSRLGAAAVKQTWLQAIETRLNEESAAIGASLSAVFAGADRLAANPGDRTLRVQWLGRIDSLTASFRQTHAGLRDVEQGIGDALAYSVDRANAALVQLGSINSALKVAPHGSALRASLEDARDGQINALTEELDADIVLGPQGEVSARHGSAVMIDAAGARTLRTINHSDGTRAVAAINAADIVDITPAAGKIAGHLAADATAKSQLSAINNLALSVASRFNSWSAAGINQSGVSGSPLFQGADAASLTALITNPDQLAFARAGQAANANLQALSASRGSWALEEGWTGISTLAASQSAAASVEHGAADTLHQSNLSALDSVTGVDLDQEAAELLRLQLAYNAAARIVRVAQETINEVIQIL
ncbi:MAG: flagellar hook-associated protein FlgK [Sphingopyxis sp.]